MPVPLVSVVGPIFDMPPLPGGILCHQATLYWMSQAQFGTVPTLPQLGQAQPILRSLARFGMPLARPSGNLIVRAGTVLVFMCGGNAAHSCVTTSDTVVGGYNQQNWFGMSGPEAAGMYTTYLLTQIRWNDNPPNTVQGNSPRNASCQLIAINEPSALGNLQTVINEVVR